MATAMLIPPASLQAMRALNEANLPHTCQVQSVTIASGSGGTHTETWTTVATYDARMTPISQDEQIVADAPAGAVVWRVALPAGTPVTRSNRLVVSGVDALGADWEKTLDVIGVRGPKAAEMMRSVVGAEVGGTTSAPPVAGTAYSDGGAFSDGGSFSDGILAGVS